ncbi:AAA family ATPase [Bacillus carboniphilus]|uniref:AAA family ATPase n=1 Tax=Bacillus carboniphilus TaxID=86663 RepID=A0ABY9JTZ6_9BACI|nr:AAA family ATPase [Bacillus carboniphilus]WLR42284.1 AAA family ATPase [Bacillus carboniphilus]
MIIMINGAFGVGKTTVSHLLKEKIENSMIFDPEEVGFLLRDTVPHEVRYEEENTDDFQDFVLWKVVTVQLAEHLISHYKVNLIVPMTIYQKDNFHYIFNGFKNIDENTYHFCLKASKDTIYERLLKRGEKEGNWCFQQTEKCLQAFENGSFREYINTENINENEVVSKIMECINDSTKRLCISE